MLHTVSKDANIPQGYFDKDNVLFIQEKVAEILSKEYLQKVIIDHGSIVRVMQRILTVRREAIPKMNQRVIMTLCNEFRVHQHSVDRALSLEEGYASSQRIIDHVGGISRFDNWGIKTTDRPKHDGKIRVGGSLRFYFT